MSGIALSGVGGLTGVVVWLQVDNGDCLDFIVAPGAGWRLSSVELDSDEATVTSVVALSAGLHTLTFCLQAFNDVVSIHAAGIFAVISASAHNDVTITIIPA